MATNYCRGAAYINLSRDDIPRALSVAQAEISRLESVRQDEDPRGCVQAESDDWGILLYEADDFGPEFCARVVQAVVEDLRIEDPVVFGWADLCTALRPGEIGGGAARVELGREIEIMYPERELEGGESARLARIVRDVTRSDTLGSEHALSIVQGVIRSVVDSDGYLSDVLREVASSPLCRQDPDTLAMVLEHGDGMDVSQLYESGLADLDDATLVAIMDQLVGMEDGGEWAGATIGRCVIGSDRRLPISSDALATAMSVQDRHFRELVADALDRLEIREPVERAGRGRSRGP